MIPSSDQIASDSSPSSIADPRAQGQPPGGVDAAAEGAEHAQPPVADLVAEALDHDRLVGGDHPRRVLLLAQELDQVVGGAAIEVVIGLAAVSGVC